MEESLDAVVIGAGVIGLAIARALAQSGREVVVLERNARIGEETSSRNSEVIHAGIYYPTDTLKAVLCVRGKELLYRYCEEKAIPHRRCGKVILTMSDEQRQRLEALHAQAIRNGVGDLQRLSAAAVKALEPAVRCTSGLFSPSTGIIDSHRFMLALQGDLEEAGGSVGVLSEVVGGAVESDGIRLDVRSGDEELRIRARTVVNASGLGATKVAKSLTGLDPRHVLETHYAKGNYFVYQGPTPFQHLVYPLPEPGGLGIHVTLDLAGQTRFGPDVEWVDRPDYDVDARRARAFYESIREYWPDIYPDALAPGYAGVRPKIVGPGEPAGDFILQGPAQNSTPGLVNLFGIESPGLTAALAIGERVAGLLE
jgi:L-2-hydroxyglutarate oxidase LhgO